MLAASVPTIGNIAGGVNVAEFQAVRWKCSTRNGEYEPRVILAYLPPDAGPDC
jgi:hypothetical protein